MSIKTTLLLLSIAGAIASAQTKKDQGFTADASAVYDFTQGQVNFGFQTTSGDILANSFTSSNTTLGGSWQFCANSGSPCVTITLADNTIQSYVFKLPNFANGVGGIMSPSYCQGQFINTNGTTIFLTPGAAVDTKCNTAGNNLGTGTPMPFQCIASHLVVNLSTSPTGTDTFSLYKNGVVITSCTIANPALQCSESLTYTQYNAGDGWIISYTTGTINDAAANPRAAFQCS